MAAIWTAQSRLGILIQRDDGFSLDDKRSDLLPSEKQGLTPSVPLTAAEHEKNNLPDVLKRWENREAEERERPRRAQSFCVPKADIAGDGAYDLSLNRYKQTIHVNVKHDSPAEIIATLKSLEAEISEGLAKLAELVG